MSCWERSLRFGEGERAAEAFFTRRNDVACNDGALAAVQIQLYAVAAAGIVFHSVGIANDLLPCVRKEIKAL